MLVKEVSAAQRHEVGGQGYRVVYVVEHKTDDQFVGNVAIPDDIFAMFTTYLKLTASILKTHHTTSEHFFLGATGKP